MREWEAADLVLPWALSFLDAFGPPVEQRRGANKIRTVL
jgi:hypothetical protein